MKLRYAFSGLFLLIVSAIFSSSNIIAQSRTTAGYFINKVDSAARTYNNNVQLGSVSCTNLDSTGKSSSWQYVYLLFDSLKVYYFTGQNNQISFDSTSRMGVGIGVIGTPWIDSDSAYARADRSGGSNIRNRFPSCVITASLGWDDYRDNMIRWWIIYKCSDSTRIIWMNAAGDNVVSVKSKDNNVEVNRFFLYQNYPNPFNPATIISFTLPSNSFVSLKIFDVSGREIATIVNKELVSGYHSFQWNAINASSGIYFYRLETNSFTQTKKLILLR